MSDDIVEHLTTIDMFEHHIMMVRMCDHFTHATYVGMEQQHLETAFTYDAHFLRGILGGRACEG